LEAMTTRRAFVPRPRRQGVVTQEIDGETLLYVEETHQASCLNPSAARIWALCDGQRTVEAIASGANIDPDVVAHALGHFAESGLLENSPGAADSMSLSRRRVLMGVGFAAIPVILMVTAPKARAAASCTDGTNNGGVPCNNTTHLCCHGLCNESFGTCN
jgi:hypothetical protein